MTRLGMYRGQRCLGQVAPGAIPAVGLDVPICAGPVAPLGHQFGRPFPALMPVAVMDLAQDEAPEDLWDNQLPPGFREGRRLDLPVEDPVLQVQAGPLSG